MNTKPLLVRAGVIVALLLLDRGLALLAIETNAAGALLSPQGMQLDAFAVAGLFLVCRLSLAFAFCGAVAWTASDAVGALVSRADRVSDDAEGAA